MNNFTVIAEPPVDDLVRSALELARICMRMDVCFLSEVRDGVRIIRHVVSEPGSGQMAAGDADPLETTYCQRILDGSIPALVHDSHAYPELLALPVTGQLDIRAHLGVPIVFSDGSVFGTFCCYSHNPDVRLGACEVIAMQRFAVLIGQLMEKRVRHERALEAAGARVHAVMDAGNFKVVFQPMVDLHDGHVIGYEALSRFYPEPVRSPDCWFNDAHLAGLGGELEIVAMKEALQEIGKLPDGAYLSLNVSPQTILNDPLAALLQSWPLERLMLEVTEHSLISNYDAVREQLTPWRRLGLRLAVDDAGSGYASFRHILQLKPDVIKLDQSLIRNIDCNPDGRALAAALVRFARETGSSVVAEGVETRSELEALKRLEVDTAQGFLLGRPGALPPLEGRATR